VMARSRLVAAGAAVLTLALAACGSSASSGSTSSNPAGASAGPQASARGSITNLTVGSSPTISNASLYYASEAGLFQKNGLSVTPDVIQSGQQAIPQLLNGQIQFAAADPLGSMLAISQGIPIEIVVGGNVAPAGPAKDPSGLIAKPGGPIKSLADLDGKTVAVNATKSLAQVALEAAIDKKGGDSRTVKWIEVPFPQMVAAVKNGTVAAAATNEPFVTAGKTAGLTEVPYGGLSTTLAGVPQVVYLASKSYVSSHPQVVKSFIASVNAANSALGSNPGEIRAVGAKSTTINAATLAKITLPSFGPPLSLAKLEELEQLMVKYGILTQPIANLSQSVITSGSS
jgi:NitT/TauT family transport system substrate-binding protein